MTEEQAPRGLSDEDFINVTADRMIRALRAKVEELEALVEETRKQGMTHLHDANERLFDVMGTLQKYQPPGSPPPGDHRSLAAWIVGSLAEERDTLREEVELQKQEIEDRNGTIRAAAAEVERLKGEAADRVLTLLDENGALREALRARVQFCGCPARRQCMDCDRNLRLIQRYEEASR